MTAAAGEIEAQKVVNRIQFTGFLPNFVDGI